MSPQLEPLTLLLTLSQIEARPMLRFEANNGVAQCSFHPKGIARRWKWNEASPVVSWSGRRDSNSRPSPWQGDTLPLSHSRMECGTLFSNRGGEFPRLLSGAFGRNRTNDTRIFNPLLYRLSYEGILWGHRTLEIQYMYRVSKMPLFGDPERARTVDLQRDRLAF